MQILDHIKKRKKYLNSKTENRKPYNALKFLIVLVFPRNLKTVTMCLFTVFILKNLLTTVSKNEEMKNCEFSTKIESLESFVEKSICPIRMRRYE